MARTVSQILAATATQFWENMEKDKEDKKKFETSVLAFQLKLFTKERDPYLKSSTHKRESPNVKSICHYYKKMGPWRNGCQKRLKNMQGMETNSEALQLRQRDYPPGNHTGNNWQVVQTNEQNWHNGGNLELRMGNTYMSVSFPCLNLSLAVLMDTGGTCSVFSNDLSHFSFTYKNIQVVGTSAQHFTCSSPLRFLCK